MHIGIVGYALPLALLTSCSKTTKSNNSIREKILKGLDLTHKRSIQSKKDHNLDIVISDHGKIVRLLAKDL